MLQKYSGLSSSTSAINNKHNHKLKFSTTVIETSFKLGTKERKAAHRKEKSRVAAQIRRNKESQTLILLQNALPLQLPNPVQTLEKSVVIRIAGQTLFLLNHLDQVLGTHCNVTVALLSQIFIGFITDATGNIVYVTPNIQSLLDQYHWINLIGMSLHDILDNSTSHGLSDGDSVNLLISPSSSPSCMTPYLSASHTALRPSSPHSSSSSPTSSNMYSPPVKLPHSLPRNLLASKLESKPDPFFLSNQFSSSSISTQSTVWTSTDIIHTNARLRLLLLTKPMKSLPQHKSYWSKHKSIGNSNTTAASSSSSSSVSICTTATPSSSTNSTSNHYTRQPTHQSSPQHQRHHRAVTHQNWTNHTIVISAHDSSYNFHAVCHEFSQMVGLDKAQLKSSNYLDIVHLEDICQIKSVLDSVIRKKVNQIWTQCYRIICRNGNYCWIRTLAKRNLSHTHNDLIFFNHVVINKNQSKKSFLYPKRSVSVDINSFHQNPSVSAAIDDYTESSKRSASFSCILPNSKMSVVKLKSVKSNMAIVKRKLSRDLSQISYQPPVKIRRMSSTGSLKSSEASEAMTYDEDGSNKPNASTTHPPWISVTSSSIQDDSCYDPLLSLTTHNYTSNSSSVMDMLLLPELSPSASHGAADNYEGSTISNNSGGRGLSAGGCGGSYELSLSCLDTESSTGESLTGGDGRASASDDESALLFPWLLDNDDEDDNNSFYSCHGYSTTSCDVW